MAYTDGLTGIYNRRYMNNHLDKKIMEIAEAAKPLSIMLFDIDHFKRVNDTLGHGVGDEVLKEMARRVSDNARDYDLVARYGGEEFVVIMPNTTTEDALSAAERLRKRIADTPFAIDGLDQPLTVTVSIGTATTIDPDEQADKLLARADTALYAAKGAGRNRTCSAELGDEAASGKAAAV